MRLSKKLFLSFCLCFGFTETRAQYRFDHWTTASGLPQNTVSGIAQTPDGYLWLATFDGLARFDGVRFTIFDKGNSNEIINNRFIGIFADRDGTVWATTENGVLTVYREGVFNSYETPEGSREIIYKIYEDENNRIIVLTREKSYYFQDGKLIPLPEEKQRSPATTYSGKPSSVWIMEPGGVTHHKNGTKTIYPLRLEFGEGFFYTQTSFEDSRGALWIGGLRNKLYRLHEGVIESFTAAEIFGAVKPFVIYPSFEDEKGNVWLAAGLSEPGHPNGLINFDGKKFQFNDLNMNFAAAIEDREGNLWFGALGGGLLRRQKKVVTTLSVKDGLANDEVYPLIQTRSGDIYIGSITGVNLYRNGKLSFLENVKLPDNSIVISRGLWENENGKLYFVYYRGFGRIEDDLSLRGFKENIIGGFTDFESDSGGFVWAASQEGLYKFHEDRPDELFKVGEGLPHKNVITLYKDRSGVLWVGTAKGLSRFENGKFTNYGEDAGMPEDFVREIYEDADGVLWIGTYGSGLVRYKDGKFFRYTVKQGLFNNGVFAIVEDERGNFWMSCNRGIYRVSKKELNDLADGKLAKIESFSYNESDGMLSAEANGGRHPSALKAKDGKIWFPTMGGVAIVDPNAETFNPKPPPVVIENVLIDHQKLDAATVYAASRYAKNVVEMQPGQSNLEIEYTGLSLIKSDAIKFKYKLEGLEDDWVDGVQRSVNYSYLPNGEHTFRVIAANASGVWNEQGAWIKIVVLPYFYETWWFRALSALAIVLTAGFIYYYRVSNLRKIADAKTAFSSRLLESQESERKRIATELHDGLGQNLIVIKNRSQLAIRKSDDPERVLKELTDISESAILALEEVREIIGDLRPQLLDRLGLSKALIAMCKKVSSIIKIDYEIDSIGGLFSENEEINIYRIVQESLNNIIKHSAAKNATVSITRGDSQVLILIQDDGKGFDAEKVKTNGVGLGLVGLKERVDLLNGELKIDSKIGEGTTVQVTLNTQYRQSRSK